MVFWLGQVRLTSTRVELIVFSHPLLTKILSVNGSVHHNTVGDELLKIVRSQCEITEENQQFTTRVISGVRFAPLLADPSIPTVIPARVWDPSSHSLYPDTFRGACNQILLCSNASRDQSVKVIERNKVNAASMLPRALWVEILSFTHRNCTSEFSRESHLVGTFHFSQTSILFSRFVWI